MRHQGFTGVDRGKDTSMIRPKPQPLPPAEGETTEHFLHHGASATLGR